MAYNISRHIFCRRNEANVQNIRVAPFFFFQTQSEIEIEKEHCNVYVDRLFGLTFGVRSIGTYGRNY